eukprot:10447505-Lingulodinium_polyedra.AAC.1
MEMAREEYQESRWKVAAFIQLNHLLNATLSPFLRTTPALATAPKMASMWASVPVAGSPFSLQRP